MIDLAIANLELAEFCDLDTEVAKKPAFISDKKLVTLGTFYFNVKVLNDSILVDLMKSLESATFLNNSFWASLTSRSVTS